MMCLRMTCVVFAYQERSPTCVRYAGRPSARAPTSSPTAANTWTSVRTTVLAASTASSTKWSCGSTRSDMIDRWARCNCLLRGLKPASALSLLLG
uniref:Uncharacterized protein n=1 Tax=Labrus bergylta TaxID=56723 RepID=A0A3Q3EJ05_9LABR